MKVSADLSALVLDSSFLIALMVAEEHSEFATQTLAALAPAEFEAPALLVWEVANVLEKKVRQQRLSKEDCQVLLGRFEELPILLHPAPGTPDLLRLAELCETHGLTAYDTAYLALALGAGSGLATLDAQLAQAARAEGLTVHCPF